MEIPANKKGKKITKNKRNKNEESILEDEEDSDFNAEDSDLEENEEDYSINDSDEELEQKNKKGKKISKSKNKEVKKVDNKASLHNTPKKADRRKQSNDMKIDSAKKNLNNKNNKENLSEIDDEEMIAIEMAFAEIEEEKENSKKSLRSNRTNNIAVKAKEERNVGLSTTNKKVKIIFLIYLYNF